MQTAEMKNYVGSERVLLKTNFLFMPTSVLTTTKKGLLKTRTVLRWALKNGINKCGWINNTFLGTTLHKNVLSQLKVL